MEEENKDVIDYTVPEDEDEAKELNNDNDPKEYKIPDILGNNKLGYNIWDTIVKGV